MVRRLATGFILASQTFAVAGCVTDATSSDTSTTTTALLSVDPNTFRGTVQCRPGELRRYVVSLHDVALGANPDVVVAVSGPVPCTQIASFTDALLSDANLTALVVGHPYIARIDGYDVDELTPV